MNLGMAIVARCDAVFGAGGHYLVKLDFAVPAPLFVETGLQVAASAIIKAAMRKNFRGSIFSKPVAGQPEAQAPQVRQRFRLPPMGKISRTVSKNVRPLPGAIFIASSMMAPFIKSANRDATNYANA